MKACFLYAALLAGLGLSVFIGLAFGATQLDFAAALGDVAGPNVHIFWQIRLPRVVMGVLVGLHFAISGMILQTTTRNALADPGILGISGGAILCMTCVVLFDVLVQGQTIEHYVPLRLFFSLTALLGGTLGALSVFALSWKGHLAPQRFVLTGVAVGSFCHACALGLIFGWGPTQLDILWLWMAGSLYGATWQTIGLILPWSAIGLVALLFGFRQIAMLRLDDDSGSTRGFAVQRWRLFSLVLACIFAGSAIGAAGPIGFVGLIVPHIARRLIPGQLFTQFITTVLVGPILCVGSDTLGRVAFAPAEIPVGVITSLIGAPVLFFLLFPLRLPFRLRRRQNVTH